MSSVYKLNHDRFDLTYFFLGRFAGSFQIERQQFFRGFLIVQIGRPAVGGKNGQFEPLVVYALRESINLCFYFYFVYNSLVTACVFCAV